MIRRSDFTMDPGINERTEVWEYVFAVACDKTSSRLTRPYRCRGCDWLRKKCCLPVLYRWRKFVHRWKLHRVVLHSLFQPSVGGSQGRGLVPCGDRYEVRVCLRFLAHPKSGRASSGSFRARNRAAMTITVGQSIVLKMSFAAPPTSRCIPPCPQCNASMSSFSSSKPRTISQGSQLPGRRRKTTLAKAKRTRPMWMCRASLLRCSASVSSVLMAFSSSTSRGAQWRAHSRAGRLTIDSPARPRAEIRCHKFSTAVELAKTLCRGGCLD